MKKLNLLLAACVVSFMSFAQLSPYVGLDPTEYAPIGENEMFTLENVWLVSAAVASPYALDNFGTAGNPNADPPVPPSPNFITPATARNMALRDGIMYFATRDVNPVTGIPGLGGLIRVNAATGERLEPISFVGTDVFRNEAGAGIGFEFQDLKVDCAGNLVVFNMMLSQNSRFQAWVVDTTNPANSHKIVDDIVRDIWLENLGEWWYGGYIDDVYVPEGWIAIPDFPIPAVRIDFFGVYGNMLEDGIILGANASGLNVLIWNVKGGEATWDPFEGFIGISPTQPGIRVPVIDGVPTPITNLGTSPTAIPVGDDIFYLNINGQPPLFMNITDGAGIVASSLFYDFPNENDELNMGRMQGAATEIVEFSLRGDYFLLFLHTNHGAAVEGGVEFVLVRFDERGMFDEMEVMWLFPGIRLGANNGGGAPAAGLSVKVDNGPAGAGEGTATIAIYSNGNGYGVYILTSRRYWEPPVSTPEAPRADALRLFVEGNVVRMNEPAAEITVFSITGQQVASAVNTNTVTIPVSGVFLVRVDGQTQRVIIR